MKPAMKAIIRKDIRGITANRQLFSMILLVPLMLSVLLPSLIVLLTHFMPEESGDFQKVLEMMPFFAPGEDTETRVLRLIIDYMLPMFFLMIPVMASSVMAGSAFVGEKEKQTLETLLYCPLSLKEIFRAKVIAAFGLGMGVSVVSFLSMLLVVETQIYLLRGAFLWPSASWLMILLLVAPALSLIAITLIVRVSAKAQNAVEAQQSAVFLVLPIIFLMAGQMTGVLLLNAWILLGIGLGAAGLAFLLLSRAMSGFTYEKLLKR